MLTIRAIASCRLLAVLKIATHLPFDELQAFSRGTFQRVALRLHHAELRCEARIDSTCFYCRRLPHRMLPEAADELDVAFLRRGDVIPRRVSAIGHNLFWLAPRFCRTRSMAGCSESMLWACVHCAATLTCVVESVVICASSALPARWY